MPHMIASNGPGPRDEGGAVQPPLGLAPAPSDRSSSSSPGSSTAESVSAISPTVPAQAPNTANVKVRRRPIPRKGHTKSRKGCYPCKRRKVKCSEDMPRCSQCQRLNLVCEFPPVHTRPSKAPEPAFALGNTPSTFTLNDLRFLHHFMDVAHPPLPVGRSDVWRRIGAFCHNYDHLAHALLGMAASHLSQCSNQDYSVEALSHRVKAINLVQDKLSAPCRTQDDGDALFGTLMLLTDQAFYMRDAMVEFVTLVRGCELTGSLMPNYQESSFNSFTRESHVGQMLALIRRKGDKVQDGPLVQDFLDSLELLIPLCRTEFEKTYLAALRKTVDAARTSTTEAWFNFMALYMSPSRLNHQEFGAFTAPDNYTGHLLLIHMFLLDHVLGQYIFHVSHVNALKTRKQVLNNWVEGVARRLPPDYEHFIRWPRDYSMALSRDRVYIGAIDSEQQGKRLLPVPDRRFSDPSEIDIAQIKIEPS